MLRALRILILMALTLVAPAAAQSQTPAPSRVALVIANGAYQSVPALTNPARDAALIANALSQAGFAVTPVARDVTKPAFEAALRDFKRRADAADIALVYYAGHGIELEEQNWLLPVDARIADPADAHTEGVSLSTVLRYVAGAKRARIVVLDACRDNPFALRLASQTRNITRGLKPVEGLPPGTVVAYAASFGQVAAEGLGQQNSPFAASLARRLVEPGLEVRFLFASVRDDVIAANASSAIAAVRSQRPWIGAELPAEQIFFVPPRPAQPSIATITVLGAEVRVSELGAEVEAFDAAAKANTAQQWRAFLVRFPNGRLKGVAEASLASLERPSASQAATTDPIALAQTAVAAITTQEWNAAEGATLVARAVAASSRAGLERLAAAGNSRAQFLVGWGYQTGSSGFPKNVTESVRLIRLASNANDARAQTLLGSMTRNGCCGVTQNAVEAVRLYRLAAAQGDAEGQASLGFMFRRGEGGLAPNETEALRLYRLAAAQGNALGQANLGFMYDLGAGGLPQDRVEAVRLYRLAAAQGNPLGQGNLGSMYYYGEGGLARDYSEALRLRRLAAAQGNSTGQAGLGMMYEYGHGGVAADRAEAVRLYRLAAQQGNSFAREQLTRLGETW